MGKKARRGRRVLRTLERAGESVRVVVAIAVPVAVAVAVAIAVPRRREVRLRCCGTGEGTCRTVTAST
mgnify:CR=1 FL=1